MPRNPYFTQSESGEKSLTPQAAGTTFDSWSKQYFDPAFRSQFLYSDSDIGPENAHLAVMNRSSLPGLADLQKSGFFNQFDLTPEQSSWLGGAIAKEQASQDSGLTQDLHLASVLAGPVIGALGGAAGGGAVGAEGAGAFSGGLSVGPEAAATLGTGGGAALPTYGLNPALAGGAEALGSAAAGGSAALPGGIALSPAALQAFNAGVYLPFASASGISAGMEGLNFSAPAGTGGTGPAAPGGLRVGPEAAGQMGVTSTSPAVSGVPATAATGGGATATTGAAAGGGIVENILNQMKNNAVALGIMGASLMAANKDRPMPNQEQLQSLSGEARSTAENLLKQYNAGTLSASQQAGLDQLTRQTKNQLTQYFSSIGQADSTAHMQALAQVDQQGLAMRQQMLDNMLQQGLAAVGVATGPLNTIAQYQMGQDNALRQAFGNFAQAVGTVFGRSAGTPTGTAVQPRQATPTPTVQSARDTEFAAPA